jgi:hypothetical protein
VVDVFNLVHGGEVSGSLFLRLPSRKEGNTRYCRRDSTGEGTDSQIGSFSDTDRGTLRTSQDHVGLQQGTFEEDVVVGKRLVAGGKDLLSDGSTDINAVSTVSEDLRLDDRDKTILLADGGVTSEGVSVLVDGELRGAAGAGVNLQDSAPLGETSALLVILGATLAQVVNTLGLGLTISATKRDNTLVDLDAGNDVLVLKHLDKGGAIAGVLV